MPDVTFDSDAFYGALDAARKDRRLNWKTMAQEAGVSPSTLTRMAQGKRPDVDSLAALMRWSGLEAASFIREGGKPVRSAKPAPLAMISTYLRSDPHLTKESATALEEMVKATYERLRTGSKR